MDPIDVSDFAGQQLQTITSVVQDELGQVWVGTSNSGLLLFDGETGSYSGRYSGLGSESIISMSYDEYTQTLVIGHPENGVHWLTLLQTV